MYAIIVTGGKQYRVEQGDIVYIEKLDVEADSSKFDRKGMNKMSQSLLPR